MRPNLLNFEAHISLTNPNQFPTPVQFIM